jgi:hypothetical protein
VNREAWNWKESMADLRPTEEVAVVHAATRRFIGYIYILLAMFVVPGALLAQTNVITTVAGQGVAGVSLSLPTGVAVDAAGSLYVADPTNCVWRDGKHGLKKSYTPQRSTTTEGLSL